MPWDDAYQLAADFRVVTAWLRHFVRWTTSRRYRKFVQSWAYSRRLDWDMVDPDDPTRGLWFTETGSQRELALWVAIRRERARRARWGP